MTEVLPLEALQARPNTNVPQEDRDRIVEVLEAEYDRRDTDYRPCAYEGDVGSMPLRWQLREDGAVAARVVMGSILNPLDRSDAADYLAYCATEENAAEVADFLVAHCYDPYIARSVARTMRRIATPQTIPQLWEYVEDVSDAELVETRVPEVAYIALAGEQRSTDPTVKRQWSDLTKQLATLRGADDELVLSQEELAAIREVTRPENIAREYAEQFYAGEPAPETVYQQPTIKDARKLARAVPLCNLYGEAEWQGCIQRGTAAAEHVYDRISTREKQPSPYGVSLGIELEIERESLETMPLGDYEADGDVMPGLIEKFTQFYDNLELASAGGVPGAPEESHGVIKEFAFRPAEYYETLGREAQLLSALGVINPLYREHPLHLTIGGITTQGDKGGGTFLLARALEAAGWSCSADRIRRPMFEYGSWNCKDGTATGVKERLSRELQLGATAGAEIRTLSLQSLSGLQRTLRSAYALGTALKAYQVEESSRDTTRAQLAAIWEAFAARTRNTFAHYGLDNPDDQWSAEQIPYEDTDEYSPPSRLDHNFIRLADLLEKAHQAGSNGSKFQSEIQDAIIDTRAQVMQLLEQQ